MIKIITSNVHFMHAPCRLHLRWSFVEANQHVRLALPIQLTALHVQHPPRGNTLRRTFWATLTRNSGTKTAVTIRPNIVTGQRYEAAGHSTLVPASASTHTRRQGLEVHLSHGKRNGVVKNPSPHIPVLQGPFWMPN
jgi:hypothetical protein